MSDLKPQSYANHRKLTPLYHFVLAPIALILLIASIVHMFKEQYSFASLLLVGSSVSVSILFVLVRQFATRLQDRIIVQEENFRHFRLTGKPLDSRLGLRQIIALRFADDESFPALCVKAAETGMEPDKIKQSITHWRADHLRV
ncbi:hypothetical protein FE783_14390 [Paenibacillus mesophilus]|uniref:DUF6526 family protein n=1 Tax=Paenibacillus mesophilus TaxID=2582849 RepID=UPI00110ECA93|nr:DUF6526 family protein [Paenibacillus mesophilus]TMV49677.1 hypothetical protein FE783_14390 [Paenibacillus mesophilus]